MTRTIVTPEARSKIIDLAREGHSPREIVHAVNILGLTPAYTATILSFARRQGVVIPYRSKAFEDRREERAAGLTKISLRLPKGTLDYLRRVGDARCMRPEQIAAELLEAIAHDKIADAVIDDGVTS
jgi:hypothetical protein